MQLYFRNDRPFIPFRTVVIYTFYKRCLLELGVVDGFLLQLVLDISVPSIMPFPNVNDCHNNGL